VLELIANILAYTFNGIALGFILFAGISMLVQFFKGPKVKHTYALTEKAYHELRRHFAHRTIISIDFFIVGELINLSFADTTEALVQILIIVIIRTIMSHFLLKGEKR